MIAMVGAYPLRTISSPPKNEGQVVRKDLKIRNNGLYFLVRDETPKPASTNIKRPPKIKRVIGMPLLLGVMTGFKVF